MPIKKSRGVHDMVNLSKQNLLTFNPVYENFENSHSGTVVIFLTTALGYNINSSSTVRVKLNLFELRTFIVAIKELLQLKKSVDYKKFAKHDNQIKTIHLQFEDEKYWININTSDNRIGHVFNRRELIAAYDALKNLCEHSERYLFDISLKSRSK